MFIETLASSLDFNTFKTLVNLPPISLIVNPGKTPLSINFLNLGLSFLTTSSSAILLWASLVSKSVVFLAASLSLNKAFLASNLMKFVLANINSPKVIGSLFPAFFLSAAGS